MSIDERLEFLLRSTESLHASVQELHAVAAEHTRHLEEQGRHLGEHTRQLEIDAQNIRSLANIAAAHQDRLDNLEGR
jgi:hypothetical protein